MDKEKKILNALDRMQEDFKKHKEKHLWKYHYTNDDIEAFLSALTKDDLEHINKNLYMNIPSNLRKHELLKEIKFQLYLALQIAFDYFTKSQFEDLESIIHHKETMFDDKKIYFYFNRGLIFPVTIDDKRILMIPKETIEFIDEVKNSKKNNIERNTEIIQITLGLIQYYGVVSLYDLFSIIERYYPNEWITFNELNIIYDYEITCNNSFLLEEGFLCDKRLKKDEINKIRNMRTSKRLDYFPVDKASALQACQAKYLIDTKEIIALKSFIKEHYDITVKQLEDVIDLIMINIKKGIAYSDYHQKLLKIFKHESVTQIQPILHYVQVIHNHTRMWVLKGYTPNEVGLYQVPVSELKQDYSTEFQTMKVGRNELCPCGSGKKYKKCCL